MSTNLLRPRQCVQRLRDEGLPVSEYTLRAWLRSGALPAARAGRDYLIFYPNLVEFLRTGGQSVG